MDINKFHGIVRYCNGEVRTPHRQEITARKETEMSNRLDDEKIRTEELFKELHNQVAETVAKVTAADEKIKTEELFKALQ